MFDIRTRSKTIAGASLLNNDPTKNDNDFNTARRDATQARIKQAEIDSRRQEYARTKTKLAGLQPLLELWNPLGKRLSIAGIRVRSE